MTDTTKDGLGERSGTGGAKDGADAAHARSKVEQIKAASRHLRGTVAGALTDGLAYFSENNIQVLKFHGVYQQDDRDLRKALREQGKERHYMMMIRARIPGGVLSADQYLAFDRLADQYGNGTLRITTRQTFQLHGVLKDRLRETIRSIDDALITTLGGCGDQVRNIVCCAAPHPGAFFAAVRRDLLALVDRLSAKTAAYHEIWIDGEKVPGMTGEEAGRTRDEAEGTRGATGGTRGVAGEEAGATRVEASDTRVAAGADGGEEPLYGDVYLPRKFKLAIAYEGDNCVDVYANDLGIVAHRDGEQVAGYTLLLGGGMGRTAGDLNTYPRLATPFAFVLPEDLTAVCEAVVKVQRDCGNRAERRFARLKYLLDERGVDWFRAEVRRRFGGVLAPPRSLRWETADDHLGWCAGDDGRGSLGIHVENGRLKDSGEMQLKSALSAIVAEHRPTVRLTTQQNLLLCDLTDKQRRDIERRLRDAGVPLMEERSALALQAMACPALPTCGLAIAESERIFPGVLREFETVCAKLGIKRAISIRMTGCPNGCARPYVAEIGLVGRSIGRYDIFVGADAFGTRLNKRLLEAVPLTALVTTLDPLLQAFRHEAASAETFGDYCERIGIDALRGRLAPGGQLAPK